MTKKTSLATKTKNLDLYSTTLNLTALDFDGNYNAILAVLSRLRDDSQRTVDWKVIVFPELSLTGPGCRDAFLRPGVLKESVESLLALESAVGSNVVATFGLPIAFEGAVYRTTAFVVGGKIRGFVAASTIRRDDLRQFSAWPRGKVAMLTILGREFPLGDLVFSERGVRFVVRSFDELVEDAGERVDSFVVPETLDDKILYAGSENAPETSVLSKKAEKTEKAKNAERVFSARSVVDGLLTETVLGAETRIDCVLCPAATPFAIGRNAKIRRILATLSKRDGNAIIYSTPVGVESGSTIYDGGSALAVDGEVCQNSRFLYVAATFGSNRVEIRPNKISWGDEGLCELDSELEGWETDENVAFEEFVRATAYATLDYMRKSRSKGFALSLSGGADSATIATTIRLGVKFACRQIGGRLFLRWLVRYLSENGSPRAFPAIERLENELGDDENAFDVDAWEENDEENECEEFDEENEEEDEAEYVDENNDEFDENADEAENRDEEVWIDDEDDDELERNIVAILLTTVYQSTRNSGDVTRRAAREIADFCGAVHFEFDVDALVEGYKQLVADATETPFSWQNDDLALQNVQARTRAPSVWLLANRSGKLLLSTGNRSEVACGYATMDGDSCGGLSPIAGIDKAFIRKWLIWEEKTGVLLDFDEDGRPIRFPAPALKFINKQQPTAELRPSEAKQTDETDLMPYSILNMFERALIRDRLELDAAFQRVRQEVKAAKIDVDEKTLIGWGVRFCRLWTQSQWKRQRFAPGFALDDYDLSPDSWTKYPILSGGFQSEIDALEARRAAAQTTTNSTERGK